MKNNNLINARKECGLTQESVAKILNCKKGTISNWENGYSSPKLSDAFKLAKLFGKDVNHLFFNEKVQVSCTKGLRKEKINVG
ncbi:transcriptional regulator [Anaerobacillus alkalidiazotrophicus]|uniref:Transcriptional regulator n=1 Tax=Anaerobacillus alkalidiazotrophicus TaxID=472963 RepID=A0A1S2MEC3_9BACI|nr:helix-turn-helix transcriptional regulator [Anaerobacillus alkalidiazotrophicus]OIJ22035.1 transcriptional regulator [Anaerobacillus alkalidiazotrophicus]